MTRELSLRHTEVFLDCFKVLVRKRSCFKKRTDLSIVRRTGWTRAVKRSLEGLGFSASLYLS